MKKNEMSKKRLSKISIEEVCSLYDYADANRFITVDLSYRDLSGLNFSGYNMTGTDFTGSDLSGCSFNDAILESAILVNVRLNGHELLDVYDFSYATISGDLLCWLSSHESFARLLPNLTIFPHDKHEV